MKRFAIIAFALLPALTWASPAHADAPVREVEQVHEVSDTDVCGFPVQLTTDGTIIRTTYTDADGTVTRIREVYPQYRMTATNLDSGEVYAAGIPGPLFITFHSDGSSTFVGTGPWQFGSNPETDEPGIFLLRGRFVVETDASGEQTFTRVGTVIDVCERLA